MKKFIFLILIFSNGIFAQTIVRGKILDKLNQIPLAGVNVIQKTLQMESLLTLMETLPSRMSPQQLFLLLVMLVSKPWR